MELRAYNVEKVWHETVTCRIGNDVGVRKEVLESNKDSIVEMLRQVETVDGFAILKLCHRRIDGETWTPYLQLVEMLILLGEKIGVVTYSTEQLRPNSLIRINLEPCQN